MSKWSAWASVLVFLASSNYCLIAGLAGVPMSCLSLAAPAAASAGHCAKSQTGHCAGRSSAKDESSATLDSPCCVQAITISSAIDRLEAPVAIATLPVTEVVAPVIPQIGRLHPSDEAPPLRRWPAPLTGRAPPTA